MRDEEAINAALLTGTVKFLFTDSEVARHAGTLSKEHSSSNLEKELGHRKEKYEPNKRRNKSSAADWGAG